MQRWILYAGLAAFGLVLLAGGAYFARKEYYLSKPAPIWVPLALRVDISMAEQSKLAEEIEERLRDEELLRQVVIDAGLQSKFGSPTEDAAVKELKDRLFVKVGTVDTPQGTTAPSINIGVKGNGHEKEATGDAASRLIKDVWKMIGIDPETGIPLERPAAGTPAGTEGEKPADTGEGSGFYSPLPDLN